ncbi:MAG: hypothetical protein M3O70_27760 [Actinomycetota bacterium]|nr:hypothetical protein [Actinomycetota bacterium]
MNGRSRITALTLALAVVALVGGGGLLASALGGDPAEAAPQVLPEVPATPMDRVAAKAHNSPLLVTDPTDERFVVVAHRVDAPAYDCGLQVSGDRGRTWLAANPVPEPPPGADTCYNPEVAFDGDGTLYYLFVGLAGRGNEPMGVFLTTSSDRAQSFSPPRQVLGPFNFSVRMAIDPTVGEQGRIHLVWLHATSDPPLGGFGPPPNPILAAHSDDGGETFSEPLQVNDPERLRSVAPALALGPDGSVHVAYYDLGDDAVDYQGLEGGIYQGTWSLVLASSVDRGVHFGQGVVVDDKVTPSERVMLIFTMPPPALVADGDQLCMGWTDGRHGDADAFASCSTDGGRRWGEDVRLNDDAVGNGRSQYQPRLSLAPNGRLDAIFYDRRASLQNLRNDVSFTYSTDRGETFAPNLTLNQGGSSLVSIGPEYAIPSAKDQVEFGSRMGLLSANASALAAWTDTRNSVELTTDQDIFTTDVTGLPAPPNKTTWAATGGAVLLGTGVVALVVAAARSRRPHQEMGVR